MLSGEGEKIAPNKTQGFCTVSLLAFSLLFCSSTIESIPSAHMVLAGFEVAGLERGNGNSRVLSLGQVIEQELAGIEIQSYPAKLASSQFLRLDVFSEKLDLVVSVIGPNQPKPLKWSIRGGVPTPISFIAEVPGSYLLAVQALKKGLDVGRYRIVISALRHASSQDQKQVAACQALSDADQLRREWKLASFQRAIKRYEEALITWRTVADKQQQAWTLRNTGDVLETISEHQKALDRKSVV